MPFVIRYALKYRIQHSIFVNVLAMQETEKTKAFKVSDFTLFVTQLDPFQ